MRPDLLINDPSRKFYHIICLFEDDFSIDWLIGLSEMKPSQILLNIETAIEEEWLSKKGPGLFTFSDRGKKEELRAQIPESEADVLNSRIAAFLMNELPEGDLEAQILSPYLLRLKNSEAGCRRLLRAGDAYVREFRPEKALECYSKIQDDLSAIKGDKADDLYIDMAIKTSKISTARQKTLEVVGILKEALVKAQKKDNKAAQALLEMHIAKNEWLLYKYGSALNHFKRGWAKAQKVGDKKLLLSATTFSTFFHYWQGRFKDVVYHYEKAVSDIEKYPKTGFPLLAAATVGICYAHIGQVTQGLGMVDAVRATCRERGDTFVDRLSAGIISTIMQESGFLDEAFKYSRQSFEESENHQNDYMSLLNKGGLAYLYYVKGDVQESVSYLKKYIQDCKDLNIDARHHTPYLLKLCWAMADGKYPQVSNLRLEKEIEHLVKGQNVFMKGLAYRYRAKLLIRDKISFKKILATLKLSEKWLNESGHQVELAKTKLEIARQHLIQGDEDKARQIAQKVADVFSKYNESLIPGDLRVLIKETPTHENLLKEILTLGQEIVTLRDSKELVQRIISTVNRITGAERGAIFLQDGQSGKSCLRLRASKNLTEEQIDHPDFQSSLDLIKRVATMPPEKASYILDTEPSGKAVEQTTKVIRSRICVPMIFKEKIVGVLYHDNQLLNCAFRESDVETLSFFAGQAAIALDNAMAYEEIQRLNQKLQEEKLYLEEQHQPQGRFANIVGESAVLNQMQAQIEQVAGTDTTVLILGETGVGKELVANSIHHHSTRRDKPFIKANCSALTETLINSELFGHERGAFTGANYRRIGRFELADTGTVFLDEIGDLPLEVQVNLLRVIQNKEFERVGGNETMRSDFRLVVATNRDLEQLVLEKKFRADLFYRLNVFPVQVPSLRERKEDIPLLAHHFIKKFSQKMGKAITRIPDGELKKLISYYWPGNIRELENIIERGVILSSSSSFKTPELGAEKSQSKSKLSAFSLEENERNHILWALDQTGWKVRGRNGAGELLKIHPSTLTTRMKKLGIKRPPKYARKNS